LPAAAPPLAAPRGGRPASCPPREASAAAPTAPGRPRATPAARGRSSSLSSSVHCGTAFRGDGTRVASHGVPSVAQETQEACAPCLSCHCSQARHWHAAHLHSVRAHTRSAAGAASRAACRGDHERAAQCTPYAGLCHALHKRRAAPPQSARKHGSCTPMVPRSCPGAYGCGCDSLGAGAALDVPLGALGEGCGCRSMDDAGPPAERAGSAGRVAGAAQRT
jgi:hypothetical protein